MHPSCQNFFKRIETLEQHIRQILNETEEEPSFSERSRIPEKDSTSTLDNPTNFSRPSESALQSMKKQASNLTLNPMKNVS